MKTDHQIEFVLKEKVAGVEITPRTINFAEFNEFNKQVEDFVAGSQRLKLDGVHVSVEVGSYKLVVFLTAAIAANLQPDLQSLQREDSLGDIDPKRAQIMDKWQTRVKEHSNVRYAIHPHGLAPKHIDLTPRTNYRTGDIAPWIKVEKYFFGTIVDMGGASKANVHIRLEDSGKVVVVSTDQEYLKGQKENRLYHKLLVRVVAQQHVRTGELRDFRLLSFEDYQPGFNEAALDRFAETGRRAWADVPDAARWVRKLRGGN